MGNIAAGEVHSEAFLRVPPDAVSRSIAGANLAYSIGAVDLFVNPALLSQHRGRDLQFSNMIDLLSTRYLSSAYSVAIGERNAIGIGLAGLNDVPVGRDSNKRVKKKKSDDYQFGIFLAYARSIPPFSIGATMKYFRLRHLRDQTPINAAASGFNLGFYYIASRTLSLGFIYQSPVYIKWENGESRLAPGSMGAGVAWAPGVVSEDFFLFLFSLDRYENEPVQMNAGVVITPVTNQLNLKNFSLRAGLGNFDPGAQTENNISDYLRDSAPTFSIGAGLGMNMGTNWEIDLDYCFQIIEFITNQHIITTRIRF